MKTDKSLKSFWDEYFGSYETLNCVQDLIVNNLDGCKLRTICWSVLLGCLPSDKTLWSSAAETKAAEYDIIEDIHKCDPRSASECDVSVNNPLSQAENSEWNKYFCNEDLLQMIQKDVHRTFPEVEYFRQKSVQSRMIKILFHFVKSNPKLSYKQGMHEILAPLLYVVDTETEAYQLNVDEFNEFLNEERVILSKIYCAVNINMWTFFLFSAVMKKIECWYISFEDNCAIALKACESESTISSKLRYILYSLLNKYDHDLLTCLQEKSILKELYFLFGFRCLRLLFSREFKFSSTLSLWDVIFATEINFIDFILVAMLVEIRDLLFNNQESVLMKYPDVGIRVIVKRALYYYKPSDFPLPATVAVNKRMKSLSEPPHSSLFVELKRHLGRVSSPKRNVDTNARKMLIKDISIDSRWDEARLHNLEKVVHHCSEKLDVLVKKFNSLMDPNDSLQRVDARPDLNVLIAELKEVRDTLRGDIVAFKPRWLSPGSLPSGDSNVTEAQEVSEEMYEVVSPSEVQPPCKLMPIDGKLRLEEEMKTFSKKS